MHKRIENDIDDERARQDLQWGGPAHDDGHHTSDWLHFIDKQVRSGWRANEFREDLSEYRQRLVKIAALAVAALESYDRLASASRPADGVIQN